MVRDRFYKPGDYYIIDDITGIKRRASSAQLQWDNAYTGPGTYSPRQPQDLVVGVFDDQSVPLPRPRQQNQFTIIGTVVTAPAAKGSTSIQVDSVVGFAPGSVIQIMLDSGVNFSTVVANVGPNQLEWVGQGLPFSVGTLYGDPIENAVIITGTAAVPAGGLMELESGAGLWTWDNGNGIAWG